MVGAIAALLLIGVIGTSMYLLVKRGNSPEVGTTAEEARAIEALAVLPFVNDGGDFSVLMAQGGRIEAKVQSPNSEKIHE